MGKFDQNEATALNERLRSEDREDIPARGRIAGAAAIAGPVVALGTAVAATGGAVGTTLAIAGGVIAGLNLLDRFLQLGGSTVRDNVREVAEAVESGLARLELKCVENGKGLKDLKALLESEEFTEGTATLVLHSLRTNSKKKLDRLAQVLISGVVSNDLEPESLDDMMRAAVELSGPDVSFLGRLYDLQAATIRSLVMSDSDRLKELTANWTAKTKVSEERGGIEIAKHRSSIARLQAQAFIQLRTPGFDSGAEIVHLLQEGAKFYERLQDIAVKE